MYKIYINDNPLFLAGKDEEKTLADHYPGCLAAQYRGQVKSLLHYVDLLEKSSSPPVVALYAADPAALKADFFGLFRYLEAAGGLVFNPSGEGLFIFRRGKWDLPKGKIDPGETPLEAALREVREETGLENLQPGPSLPSTFHTYREKGKRILKQTYWFVMDTPNLTLIPQTEEDIEKAAWFEISSFLSRKPDLYNSIREVVEAYLWEGKDKI